MIQNDNTSPCPMMEQGQIIPAFSLPGPDGMPHSPWDYKQRDHLGIMIVHATTQTGQNLLRAFSQHYQLLRTERCALLAITTDPVIVNADTSATLQLPFPLLADVSMRTIRRYTAINANTTQFSPCIVLADLYNACFERWVGDDETQLPDINDILASLSYLNNLCKI